MNSWFYPLLCCSTLLFSHHFAFGNEPDDGELYDDYNSNETEEPFTTMKTTTKAPCAQVLHLRGPTNMKPIRYTKCCGFRCYKVEDNITCYDIDLKTAQKMKRHKPYSCPVGKCLHGKCERSGLNETCIREGTLDKNE
uniref:Evasin n=1 Tax=Amblyomma americanum TaxID=6943 RepID=A0A0C9R5A0_AMBAM